MRCNINRDNYKVPTGLYKFASPDENSEVIVTGNYKLTFDYLRKYLKKSYWVVIIDTDGINVWCAAGKGRFASPELIRMLREAHLPVNHNRIILPQLSAPGIQSHLVEKQTGKKVIFGPVRISDMDAFVDHGIKEGMRNVTFSLKERLKLIPIELVSSVKMIIFTLLMSYLTGFWLLFKVTLSASLIGNVLFPLSLPFLPFKMFYKNSFLLSLLLLIFYEWNLLSLSIIALGMLYTAYLGMNFTGSTTFTSLTGVKKELDEAIPRMIKSGVIISLLVIVAVILEVL